MDNKIFKIVFIALLGLSALLSILFMLDVVSEGLLINWCYILLGIATVSAIVFSLMNMIKNPKKAKSALIGIVALLIICGIGYVMAGSEEHIDLEGNILADAATSQKSEGGLIAFYILAFLAIASIVYAEVSKMFK
ncbi:MAG: hypothetical protein KDD41_02140 [Flavobacteriales bacterium]|nr:hypothetical protein [Flavobacteriales bacterium]